MEKEMGSGKLEVSFSTSKSRYSGDEKWWKCREESSGTKLCLLTTSHLFQLNPQFQRQELVLPGHGMELGRDQLPP